MSNIFMICKIQYNTAAVAHPKDLLKVPLNEKMEVILSLP